MFEQVLLATGEQGDALTAAVNSSSDRDCAASGQCAPSLSSTCGFSVQQIPVDGSSRCAADKLRWATHGVCTPQCPER